FYRLYKFQQALAHLQILHFTLMNWFWVKNSTIYIAKNPFQTVITILPWYLALPPIIAFTMVNG
ncbi:10382_t:CDS:1, partial [Scutellospora calospora]